MVVQGQVIDYGSRDAYMGRRMSGFSKPPGIYRAKFSYQEGLGEVNDQISLSEEIERLKKVKQRPAKRGARTLSPGVKGYQQRTDASASAQSARLYETGLLITLLETLSSS